MVLLLSLFLPPSLPLIFSPPLLLSLSVALDTEGIGTHEPCVLGSWAVIDPFGKQLGLVEVQPQPSGRPGVVVVVVLVVVVVVFKIISSNQRIQNTRLPNQPNNQTTEQTN